MMKKKFLVITVLLSIMMFLFGCGESFPELTEEEYDQTVEFAVGLLMKYSNNDQSKLTKINVKELQKQREKEARTAAEKEKKAAESSASQQTKTQTQTTVTPKPEETQTTPETKEEVKEETAVGAEETSNIEETTATDEQKFSSDDLANAESTEKDTSEQETAVGGTAVNPNALVLNSEYSLEVTDDIFLSYQGYSVSSTFPESSKSYVINADKGKKLLVLRFDLYNASGAAKKVNMIDKGILIQTLLNGKNLGYNAVTFLPNDLTSFVGTIDSKAHESLVVLSEIDSEASTNIQTLGMIVTIGGKEQEVSLQ